MSRILVKKYITTNRAASGIDWLVDIVQYMTEKDFEIDLAVQFDFVLEYTVH